MTAEQCLPITVIVPTYNDSNYLREALTSILIQSAPPEVLIVVDDGSHNSDASNIAREFEKSNQFSTRILYLKQINKGPSSARNTGLRLVRTPYVTFLDADDYMVSDNLKNMWRSLDALTDDYFGVYGTHRDRATGKLYPYGNLDGCVATSKVGRKRGVAGGVHTFLFRTHHLVAIEGFDENLVNNEDYDLIIRLLRQGLKCKGKVTICFEKNSRLGSLTRPQQPAKAFENNLKFLRKAERLGYFSANELEIRKRGAQLSYAKRLMEQGDEASAKNVWQDALSKKPGSLRELYHWIRYILLTVKIVFFKSDNKH
ncbi:glycosyltransferase family A protein [Vreelandella sulfidaeris]|uniref:glycosyltransferase family A protein n=1 Tax=Vreelandella sulfidaeris TaxID=115553 RepID=UPI0035E53B06